MSHSTENSRRIWKLIKLLSVSVFALGWCGLPASAADPIEEWGIDGMIEFGSEEDGDMEVVVAPDGRLIVLGLEPENQSLTALISADGQTITRLGLPAGEEGDRYTAATFDDIRPKLARAENGNPSSVIVDTFSPRGSFLMSTEPATFGEGEIIPNHVVVDGESTYVSGIVHDFEENLGRAFIVSFGPDGTIQWTHVEESNLSYRPTATVGITDNNPVAAVVTRPPSERPLISLFRLELDGPIPTDDFRSRLNLSVLMNSSTGTAVLSEETTTGDPTWYEHRVSIVDAEGSRMEPVSGRTYFGGIADIGLLRDQTPIAVIADDTGWEVRVVGTSQVLHRRTGFNQPYALEVAPVDGSLFISLRDFDGQTSHIVRLVGDDSGRFIDDDRSVHQGDIEELEHRGWTSGCNPPTNDEFCPAGDLTRGEMAAFLSRALSLPRSGTDSFADDDDSIFESDINTIAEAGITQGCNPPDNSNYCPDRTVARGEMAAFLHRALQLPKSGIDHFADDNRSVFESDINAIAEAGITQGCNPPENTNYCPDQLVTRGQMASMLIRSIDYR